MEKPFTGDVELARVRSVAEPLVTFAYSDRAPCGRHNIFIDIISPTTPMYVTMI
jgi:hypothetical protein